jgi:pimeloyl-ACP methyl ester carboxylesterase
MLLSDTVLRSAMASKLAYAKSTPLVDMFPISKQLCPDVGKYRVIDCARTGAHAYVWTTGGNSKVISFRGSHDTWSVLRYVIAARKEFAFCDRHFTVHHMVFDMFMDIEPELTDMLFNGDFSRKQHLTFCGHSLGGALAMFCAAYYAHMTHRRHAITCHAFGAPKVGNDDFMNWFNAYVPDAVSIRNKWDIVPRFPFGITFSDDMATYTFQRTSANLLEDHDLDTYISNIRNGIHYGRMNQ